MSNQLDIEKLKTIITDGVVNSIQQICRIQCEKNPEFQVLEIIEYNSRMRVVPLEKFNGACYVAAINFYLTQQDMDESRTIGAMVVFFEENTAHDMLEAVSKEMDDNDETIMLDNCGEICNVLVGQVKSQIKNLGYSDNVISSAPEKYKNDVPGGVAFQYSETKIYQLTFKINDKNAIIVETTLAPPV